MMGLSNIRMKNEEARIDTVRDDEDITSGDVDDDEYENDNEEVIEIKMPLCPSSSSPLNGAADAALRPSMEIHISLQRVRPGATWAEASRASTA